MSGLPVLSIITWAPFAAALVIMAFGRTRPQLVRWSAAIGVVISSTGALWIFQTYDQAAAGFQFGERFDLVPSLGIAYELAADGMSIVMVLLTAIIILAGVFASWTIKSRDQEFYALLLLLVTGVFGVFVSLDLFVFFLFYEIAVLPMYLLIGIWGSSGDVPPRGVFGWAYRRTGVGSKEYAAMKLTLYLLFGSAFILVGILALYVAAGSTSFSLLVLEKVRFDPALQSWVFLAFYVGFGILAAIFPFHTWSPDGHASAPTAVSMLHAGVLMKLGAYGVVRLGMGLLPEATHEWMWLVGLIACINIVWGALSAMAQTDLKYVIVYSSVSHMGIVMLGAATLTESGLNGAVFQMFAHGIMTGLFFALVGLVYEKAHSREIFKMGGFASMMPGIAAAFTIGGLSSLGLPATSGFVAEILTFLGAWTSAHPWWLFPGVIGAFLTSLYVLRVVRAIFWGPKSADPHFQHLPDAQGTEWVALVLLVFVIVLFGVAPGLALSPIDVSTVPLLIRLGGALMTALTELVSRPLALELGVFGLLLVVFVSGLLGAGRSSRLPGWVTLVGLGILTAASVFATAGGSAFGATFVLDELSIFVKTLFLGSAALSVLAALGLSGGAMARRSTEYHVALLASLLGMLVLASARDLVLLFVSFELMSIPLYVLTGFEKKSEAAPEGALKFFLVGSVSSAVILYGLSFVFGATGTTAISAIGPAMQGGNAHLLLGLVLTLAGLGFKIAAVPFHMWVPDVYEAAGTPFVAWLSVAPKAAGFVAIIRLFVEGAGPSMHMWVPAAAGIGSVTIVAGNLMAIPQQNIKRLLGYSGIAHIGYLLMDLAAMSTSGIGMLLFYLVAYLFGNMGAFFVVQAVARTEQSDQIDVYSGLARRSPALALALLVFLLSLGGIPFMAGFWAKLFIFWAVVERGMYWLAFLGAVATVVALYYYLVVAKRMYIDPPPRPDAVPVPGVLFAAIIICMAGVVIMGLYPAPWVAVALRAAAALF